ncbi:hypothetical protein [Legionella tunisiensis]|uniref:hypothetical protein n=1 Tax=Legionella tunisiensis TaxID=1034944 RepID=UPI0002D3D33C|nr:hypothetical protein [Legionella tunisiensis]
MFSDRKTIAQKKLEEMKKIATEQLNKADQYVLMHEGRADLATLTPLKVNSQNEFVLQWDRQLPPYSEETVSELKTIKELGLQWIKKDKLLATPTWFRRLPLYQQAYFHGSKTHINSLENLAIDLNKLLSVWIKIKTKSSLQEELRNIAAGGNNLPAWFTDLSTNHQNLISNLVSPTITVKEVNNNLQALEARLQKMCTSNSSEFEEITQLKSLPYWYLTLTDYEQRFLNAVLAQVERVEDAISFIPSRLRTLPILANFAEHQLFLLDHEGNITKKFPAKLRSSHLASRDVADQLHQIGELYTLRNLAKIRNIAANRRLLLQTLISPVKLLSGFMPDYLLEQHRKKAVATAQKEGAKLLFSTNHPFNMVRVLYPTPATDPGCLALLQQAEAHSVLSQLPELEGHWSYDQIQELVGEACAAINVYKEALQDGLSPSNFYDLGSKSLKENLTELFHTNYQELQQLPDWQDVVSQHLFIIHNRLNSEQNQTFETYKQGLDDLTALAKEYRAVLNSPFGSATLLDYSGRELFLSSLENLLIMHMDGVSYGSCVSGKDRKAIEIIHTDAMLLYRELYDRWPGFTDTGAARRNFVKLVVELYISRHGAEHAGQNAPGADSIKTPANYWPADIAEAICDKLGKKALSVDDVIATNNEVGKNW